MCRRREEEKGNLARKGCVESRKDREAETIKTYIGEQMLAK